MRERDAKRPSSKRDPPLYVGFTFGPSDCHPELVEGSNVNPIRRKNTGKRERTKEGKSAEGLYACRMRKKAEEIGF
jgi:hypothetical protein